MPLTGLNHAGLQVRDLERSLAFYRDVLGLELVTQWVRDEDYIQELVGYPGVALHSAILRVPTDETFLELIEYRNVDREPVDTATANPGTAHVCFYVDDLDAFHRHLVAEGVEAISEPVTPTVGPNKGGRAVYVIDPDGIRVELVQTTRSLAGDLRT